MTDYADPLWHRVHLKPKIAFSKALLWILLPRSPFFPCFSFSTFPAPFIFSKADQREEFCGGVWNQTQCQQVAFSPSLLFSVLFRKTPVLLLNATVRVLTRNQCTSLNLLMLMFFLMSPPNSSLCPPFHHLSHLSNTGRWARGAKPRLNLLSEPRLILYSSPLK